MSRRISFLPESAYIVPEAETLMVFFLADEGTVIYSAKDGKDRKICDAQEWLATMYSHVPNLGEQRVRYYGWYSNVARGKRQKLAENGAIPYIIESDRSAAACRKSWAKLIRIIYEIDPLTEFEESAKLSAGAQC
jgi:hypothetical protein